MDRFTTYLHDVHLKIKKMIYQSSESQQGHFVHQLTNWAKKIAQTPLSSSDETSNTRDTHYDKNELFPGDNLDCIKN